MKRTTRILLPAFLFPVLLSGCSTPVDVEFDERQDFSHYRTWAWVDVGARATESPEPSTAGLDRELALAVERELLAKGLQRADGPADLIVGASLNLHRQVVTILETGATQQLSSLHASPSYQVQVQETREAVYEQARLVVYIADSRERRVVWQGVIEDSFLDGFAGHLDDFVSRALESFPPPPPSVPRPVERGPAPRDNPRNDFSTLPGRAMIGTL